MKYFFWDFHAGPGHKVIVELYAPANVLLLDEVNYYNYTNGLKYSYYGGLIENVKEDVIIHPPEYRHWYLVVDNGSNGEPPITKVYIDKTNVDSVSAA